MSYGNIIIYFMSMATAGFLVEGLGNETSINSASHGAGRTISRTQAKNEIMQEAMDASLEKAGVTLIGGGLDEAPTAYKDIHAVINAQTDLVKVVATLKPRIVRMDNGNEDI